MKYIEDASVNDGITSGTSPAAPLSRSCPGRSTAPHAAGDPAYLPEARNLGREPDDHAVVPVQRDLLQLCPRAGQVLPRQQQHGAPVRPGAPPGQSARRGPDRTRLPAEGRAVHPSGPGRPAELGCEHLAAAAVQGTLRPVFDETWVDGASSRWTPALSRTRNRATRSVRRCSLAP